MAATKILSYSRTALSWAGLLSISACASSQTSQFSVQSNPPGAQVDVNGISMGNTPTQISLACSKHWIGVVNSPDGWAYDAPNYNVTVYPAPGAPGYSQTKLINPCQVPNGTTGTLRFDLGLGV